MNTPNHIVNETSNFDEIAYIHKRNIITFTAIVYTIIAYSYKVVHFNYNKIENENNEMSFIISKASYLNYYSYAYQYSFIFS